jgi:hypothetical protein
MPWLIALNVLLYAASIYLFFAVGMVPAAICFLVAALLSLFLSGGKFDAFDIF